MNECELDKQINAFSRNIKLFSNIWTIDNVWEAVDRWRSWQACDTTEEAIESICTASAAKVGAAIIAHGVHAFEMNDCLYEVATHNDLRKSMFDTIRDVEADNGRFPDKSKLLFMQAVEYAIEGNVRAARSCLAEAELTLKEDW